MRSLHNSIENYLIYGFLLVISISASNAIMCYHCNSAYDPRCGDPFDSYSLGVVNCSMQPRAEHLQDTEPTLCRKSHQRIEGKTRVVRGCGYIKDSRDDKECVRRSGTHDVILLYCACTTELCNSGNSINLGTYVIIGTMFMALIPWLRSSIANDI